MAFDNVIHDVTFYWGSEKWEISREIGCGKVPTVDGNFGTPCSTVTEVKFNVELYS